MMFEILDDIWPLGSLIINTKGFADSFLMQFPPLLISSLKVSTFFLCWKAHREFFKYRAIQETAKYNEYSFKWLFLLKYQKKWGEALRNK